MRSIYRWPAILGLLAFGCGNPIENSEPGFSYHVTRSNGEELDISGAAASWAVTTRQTNTGFQSRFDMQLGGATGGDNQLTNPTVFVESGNDDLAQSTPDEGRYTILIIGDQYLLVSIGTSHGSFTADGGTITITGSSGNLIEGTLDLHFVSDNSEDPTFDLVGSFTAEKFAE